MRQLACDDGVTNECIYRAIHTAPLPMQDGSALPRTNRRIELRFCKVWRIRDGEVIGPYNYADNLGLMYQLGVIPAPAAADVS